MPPGQTILWVALVILLCLTPALAADKKKNDITNLVHSKQPENTTLLALMDDPNESTNCDVCKCDGRSCEVVTPPTPEPILPMYVKLYSSKSHCCQILEDAIDDLYIHWASANTTSIKLISEEKIANRCSYYDDVLKQCRHQCPLYAIMCHDQKKFVEEFKCIRGKPRENTTLKNFWGDEEIVETFKACSKDTGELVFNSIDSLEKIEKIGGFVCRLAQKFVECGAKIIHAECGPIAKALYMNVRHWSERSKADAWLKGDNKFLKGLKSLNYDNLTGMESDCLAYLNFRINNTLLGSSSSHNTAYGTLIAAILVICMLPLEVITALAQNRPKASSWIMVVLILGLATGLVLSDDTAPQTCEPCTTPQCEDVEPPAPCKPFEGKIEFKLKGISSLCCQPFMQPLDIDEKSVSKVVPTGILPTGILPIENPTYAPYGAEIMLKEETLKQRCGLYNESLKDCREECPLYGMICTDPQQFMEGLKCFAERLKELASQVESGFMPPVNRSEIVCEPEYNYAQLTNWTNITREDKCERRHSYYMCVEKKFNETCPGIGAWLGLMHFFNPRKSLLSRYYSVEDSIEPKCLLYANYIGKHTSPPGSSSPWNAVMSLGFVAAAIIVHHGIMSHRILMNFR